MKIDIEKLQALRSPGYRPLSVKVSIRKMKKLGLLEGPIYRSGYKRYIIVTAAAAASVCVIATADTKLWTSWENSDVVVAETQQTEDVAVTMAKLMDEDGMPIQDIVIPIQDISEIPEMVEDEPLDETTPDSVDVLQEDNVEFQEEEAVEEEITLVMVDVTTALNVRTGPSPDAEKAGLMYKGCGGTVLERRDGWTKLESGDLVGWASDEYLVFGEEALAMAEEYGNYIATSEASSLRVREKPDEESTILGVLKEEDVLEATGVVDGDWAEVAYKGGVGYVSTEYVTVEFKIDEGETIEVIREREAAYAAAQAKKREQAARAAAATVSGGDAATYEASADDLTLMATIIYCEAGNQSYEGMVAVGAVVMNRVNSSAFPNTIEGVLRASRQFSPVGSGKFDRVLQNGGVPELCWQAAQDALSGTNNVGGALYFKNPKLAGAHEGLTIGDHVFW